jgi:hypothetical protein
MASKTAFSRDGSWKVQVDVFNINYVVYKALGVTTRAFQKSGSSGAASKSIPSRRRVAWEIPHFPAPRDRYRILPIRGATTLLRIVVPGASELESHSCTTRRSAAFPLIRARVEARLCWQTVLADRARRRGTVRRSASQRYRLDEHARQDACTLAVLRTVASLSDSLRALFPSSIVKPVAPAMDQNAMMSASNKRYRLHRSTLVTSATLKAGRRGRIPDIKK